MSFVTIDGANAAQANAAQATAPQPNTKQAQLVDAVRAAVTIMNKGGSSADIMGVAGVTGLDPKLQETLADTDRILRASCKVAVQHQQTLDPARLIRLGLFTNDWLNIRDASILINFANNLTLQEVQAFNQRARAMAQDLVRATQSSATYGSATQTKFPWVKIAFGATVVAIGIFSFRVWRARRMDAQEQRMRAQFQREQYETQEYEAHGQAA